MAGRNVDEGDKIILPPSALDKLARLEVEYPMLFEIKFFVNNKISHCGVLEFSAEEGWCYMPFWMMQNLSVEEGCLIGVKNVSLSKASFVKFRAQSVDFLEVSNPRAVLEVALRKFTCLTEGDVISIPYLNGRSFYLDVREVKPNGCASIIETDCNVDFEEPLGYKESKYAQYERDKIEKLSDISSKSDGKQSERVLQKSKIEDDTAQVAKFNPFSGSGKRIDGRETHTTSSSSSKEMTTSSTSSKLEESKNSSSNGNANGSISNPLPTYQSRIGDKYSKKKTAVAAFAGAAHKLT